MNQTVKLFVFLVIPFLLFGIEESYAQNQRPQIDSYSTPSNYVMEIWDNSNGLPQNAVFALEKDNQGYLWIATEEGLVRLDGMSSKVFDMDTYPIMQEQTYYTFFKTKGGIWATADRSIALLEKNILKVIDCSSITGNTWIRAIAEDEQGDLVIGTAKGEIHRWKNNTFSSLEFWNPEIQLEIQSFFPLSPNLLLVGTTQGLYKLDFQAQSSTLISPVSFAAMKVFGFVDYTLIFSPDSGIFRLNQNDELENIIPIDPIEDINLSSLTLDSENRIWGSSLEKGLIIIENGEVSRIDYPEISNYTIRRIIKEENNLYLGTLGKGLAIVKPAKVQQLGFEVLKEKNIKPVFQDKDSSVWIGTKVDGLHRIVNGEIQSWTEEDGLLQNGITSIASLGNKLYAGSPSGISVIDINSGEVIDQITQEEGLRNDYVQALFKDSNDWLWVLSRNGGMQYLDNEGQLQFVDLPIEFSTTRFVSILELKNKEILIGSFNDGIFRIKDGKFVENQTLPLTPGEDVIYCMHEDASGDLWFGTHGGLILLKDGKFKSLIKANGLKSQSVYSITDDGNNGFWISNNFGVQYFSYEELNNFKESEEDDFLLGSTLYNQSMGMPNSETNGLIFPAAIKDYSGKIWIPTVEGIGIIDPTSLSEKPKAPTNFVWDELQIGEEKSPIQGEIEIPEGVRMFQVSFSLIDFENPSQYSVFYRINSNSGSWLPINEQRLLFFNGLKPGKYTLEIKILRYGQTDGIYSLPIKVAATFFETPLFWISIVIALLLLIYFIFQSYFNSKLKKELEAQVTQRTLELSQTNEKLKEAVKEIEDQNVIMKQLTWDQSHLLRAPLTKAMGINQLLIKYSKYSKVGKSKEELEIELLETLKQVDDIVKDTHSKSENLTK